MSSRDNVRASRWASVEEARRSAERHLPSWLYAGLTMGNGSLVTARANTASFDEIGFVPVAAASGPQPDISTTLLGRPVDVPVLCAPTGSTRIFHPGGDGATARATKAAGSIDVVAWDSGWSVEDVRAAAPDARLWQQIYWVRGRDGCEEIMVRAEKAGYEAIVMTLDVAVSPRAEVVLAPRRRSVPLPTFGTDLLWRYGPAAAIKPRWSTRFVRDRAMIELYQPRIHAGTPEDRLSPSWAELQWVREQWRGPLVLKGILTVEDAQRAADLGAEAIIVSNHGGKCLDTVPSTMSVLPRIVDAVGDRLEVCLDSGIRRGSDVVKALSAGARAVLVGQAYLFGLAVAGEAGVARILEILAEETRRTMSLIGARSVADLDRSRITLPPTWTGSPTRAD